MKTKLEDLKFDLTYLSDALFTNYANDFVKRHPKRKELIQHVKGDHRPKNIPRCKNQGQYGYWNNRSVDTVAELALKYELSSILDLGSGPGIMLFLLKFIDNNVGKRLFKKLKGYEIEPLFVKDGNNLFFSRYGEPGDVIEKKDILKITTRDLIGYEIVYFWEPLHERELAEKFVSNLSRSMIEGQYIFYYQSGFIGEFLKYDPKFVPLECYNNIQVYQFKSKIDV
jgi:hypothetical protein